MGHECYSFKLMCRPVKVHIVMLGTEEQTGQRLIHYTLLSVQITLPEHNRRLPVCVARPLWSKTESSGNGAGGWKEEEGKETEGERNSERHHISIGSMAHTHTLILSVSTVFLQPLEKNERIHTGRVSIAWWGKASLKPCGPQELPQIL